MIQHDKHSNRKAAPVTVICIILAVFTGFIPEIASANRVYPACPETEEERGTVHVPQVKSTYVSGDTLYVIRYAGAGDVASAMSSPGGVLSRGQVPMDGLVGEDGLLRQWWFWVIVGVVVVGITAVMILTGDEGGSDTDEVPPFPNPPQ